MLKDARYSVVPTLAALLVVAGCETVPVYHPSESVGSPGYSDEQLAANRYRVTFTGTSSTRREVVENYLLLRSAEVTLKAGYHYFTFDTRDTKANTTYHSYESEFMGWPGRGWYRHNWAFGPEPVATITSTRYEAYAEIILLTDEQAKNDPHALGAQDVLNHIGPAPKS
ncbi:MAG: hypothetical protein WCA81_16220 [Rhizomicrobium sp.]